MTIAIVSRDRSCGVVKPSRADGRQIAEPEGIGGWPRRGAQSTMNSLAPVLVDERCAASPKSDTW
jgi:hypothetical protein